LMHPERINIPAAKAITIKKTNNLHVFINVSRNIFISDFPHCFE